MVVDMERTDQALIAQTWLVKGNARLGSDALASPTIVAILSVVHASSPVVVHFKVAFAIPVSNS